MYSCERCNKTFTRKQGLTDHMNKKNKCFEDGIIKCHLCNKEFDRRDYLNKHLNRKVKCNGKIDEEIDKEIDKLIEEKIQKIMKGKDIRDDKTNNANNINNTNNIINSTITTNSNNNSNNNNNITINNTFMINYASNNYPSAKNLEDCVKIENVTKLMIEECKNLYFIDGSIYIIQELIGDEEDKRPLHCTDPSRNNYIYKTKGNWKIDIGGSKIKSQVMPVIEKVYNVVHEERMSDLPIEKHLFYLANVRGKDMISSNVDKVYTKAMNSIKTNCLAKNNKDLAIKKNNN